MRETLAIFDFDGTLTRGDTLFPFLRFVAGLPGFVVRVVKLLPILARFALGRVPNDVAKEAVLKAFDTTMEGGLEFERKNFYMLFASEDQKEGMKAFVEKRKPEWKGT